MPQEAARRERHDIIMTIVQGVRTGAQTERDAATGLQRLVTAPLSPPMEPEDDFALVERLLSELKAFQLGAQDLTTTTRAVAELSDVAIEDRDRFLDMIRQPLH